MYRIKIMIIIILTLILILVIIIIIIIIIIITVIVSFKYNRYFFSAGTPTTSKLDDGITATHFQRFKYRYSKQYSNFKFHTNSMADR